MENVNPQLENGHIKIATELWEALIKYRIPGEQRQVLDFIIRKTYGWHKKQDGISYGQFVDFTGIKKSNVIRAIKELKKKKVIRVLKKEYNSYATYEFNKKYTQWERYSKKSTALKKEYGGYSKESTDGYSKESTTIDTITKATITKATNKRSNKKMFEQNSIQIVLSNLLLAFINGRNWNFKAPDIQKWAVEVDRMLTIDRRNPCAIMNVICWCQADEFWQNNILSTAKLRKQFDQVKMRMLSITQLPKQQQIQLKNAMESERWLNAKQ